MFKRPYKKLSKNLLRGPFSTIKPNNSINDKLSKGLLKKLFNAVEELMNPPRLDELFHQELHDGISPHKRCFIFSKTKTIMTM